MDVDDLQHSIDYVESYGVVLSPEQKCTLQTSLQILKHENHFETVNFWGIIRGVSGDYFIAQGIGRDVMTDRRSFYSKDCLLWGILPVPSKRDKYKAKLLRSRFTGDPSFENEYIMITIKEEDRLAAVVEIIDEEVVIVPRGAYLRLASGQVIRNKNFEGLSLPESSKLFAYLHFRPPIKMPNEPLIDRAKMDKAIDFLDTIEEDIPIGCWSIKAEKGGSVVLVQSLLWLGYVLFHLPTRNKHGSIYVGTGEYNIDLPFML